MVRAYVCMKISEYPPWGTTTNAPYEHQRLDSILEMCRTFPII